MQYSSNYGFKLPQTTDAVSIGDINYNFSWIDGNLASTINSVVTANLDTTLAVAGKPADAKATGDKITSLGANDLLMSGYVEPSPGVRPGTITSASTITQAIQIIVARLNRLEQ